MKRVGLGALCLASSFTTLAHANGRYPAAGQVVPDPGDSQHFVVRTTYGAVSTRDYGATWQWICEAAMLNTTSEDPALGMTEDGRIFGGLAGGLITSANGGCDFTLDPTFEGKPVLDVSVDRSDPKAAIALSWSGLPAVGSDAITTRVFVSKDNAATWTKVPADLPEGTWGQTLDRAPSDSDRIVVGGSYGTGESKGGVWVSKDGGETFSEHLIEGADSFHIPFLSAIDPVDPDKLYVRLLGNTNDTLLFSDDAGETFTPIYTAAGRLLGFALSPDGSQVLVGGPDDGIQSSATDSFAFVQVSELPVKCLAWVGGSVYACVDEFVDGYSVGVSSDGGHSFAPFMRASDLEGPIACPESSSAGSLCPAEWDALACQLGIEECDAGDLGNDVPSAPAQPETEDSSGCGVCGASPSEARNTHHAWIALLAVSLVFRRRRGVRSSPRQSARVG